MSNSIGELAKEKLNHISQDNVINVNNSNLINVNNVRSKEKAYSYNIVEVQQIAHSLVDKLQDEASYKFFCKVAWKLPQNQIWLNLEQALAGKNPRAYFTFLCKLAMEKDL